MWAVLLGVVLMLAAVTSSHAAQTLTAAHRPAVPAAGLSIAVHARAGTPLSTPAPAALPSIPAHAAPPEHSRAGRAAEH